MSKPIFWGKKEKYFKMSSAEIFIQHDEPVQSTEYEASTEQIVQTDKITQADTWLCNSLSVSVRPVSYF